MAKLDNNILNSVKKTLGLDANYAPFDDELVVYINTILGVVNQLGVGVIGYTIDRDGGAWDEFLVKEIAKGITVNEIKTYIAKRVQMLFDPPTSGIYMDALKQIVSELEWRITVAVETPLSD